jgi:lipoyl(octanoyl) transferase
MSDTRGDTPRVPLTLADDRLELIIDEPAPGEVNMARDLALLDACAHGEIAGAVRLYGFDPACLSLGRMQPLDDVDLEACARDSVDVVRRPSGGRAVLHDQEVTYSVVCRSDDPVFGGRVLESCARIHEAVATGLGTLGVRTTPRAMPANLRRDAREVAAIADCFARPAAHELLDDRGRKLVGSAQARRAGALLQHGSVLLDSARAAGYLRGGSSATPPAGIGVRQLLGREVGRLELVEALAEGFRRYANGSLNATA